MIMSKINNEQKKPLNHKTTNPQKIWADLQYPHSCQSGLWYRRTPQSDPEPWKCWAWWSGEWNESGFRPPLCTYRLNWARRTSWGWWDDWDDTALQIQNLKFEPWRSEAEHATSRSRRLPTILTWWSWENAVVLILCSRSPARSPEVKNEVKTRMIISFFLYSCCSRQCQIAEYYLRQRETTWPDRPAKVRGGLKPFPLSSGVGMADSGVISRLVGLGGTAETRQLLIPARNRPKRIRSAVAVATRTL